MFPFQTVCKNRPDKEEVPCNECGKLFPTRKHLSEHRRTKHRESAAVSSSAVSAAVPLNMVSPQNMGHNLGQYFSQSRVQQHGQHMLPPFSRQYSMPSAAVPTMSAAVPTMSAETKRCDVCHAFFPSESSLKEHISLHWSQHCSDDTKMTGSVPSHRDLTLTQAAAGVVPSAVSAVPPMTTAAEAENVGSLLRQVYHTEHHEQYPHLPGNMPSNPHSKLHHNIPDTFCDYQHPAAAFDSFLYYNA